MAALKRKATVAKRSRPKSASSAAKLKRLISHVRIARRLSTLARKIRRDVPAGERPVAIVVLQGAFIFAADLLRQFPDDYPLDVAFLRCQSYGNATVSSGRVVLLQDIDSEFDLRGRTVLLIDDILDTGLTLQFLVEHLRKRGAKRVRTCVLLTRRNRPSALRCDFTGFAIGDEFVVGYGLDHAGRYRQLPFLAALDNGTADSR